MRRLSLCLVVLALLPACRTAPPKIAPPVAALPAPLPPVAIPSPTATSAALVRLNADQFPAFIDDADTTSLREAAVQSSAYYRSLKPTQSFRFGPDTYSAAELAESMDTLIALLNASKTPDDWIPALKENFAVYQSIGADADKTVTFSSYYEPTIPGRLAPDAQYRYPMYGHPSDMYEIDLGNFIPAYQGVRIVGRPLGRTLVPYYRREDIDGRRVLAGRELEIAYARNPLDIFFLQVEGSGWLDPEDGSPPVRIRYDGNNGRPFRSVGNHLIKTGRIPKARFNHDAFVRYMDTHPKERQSLLNYDERYIFFRIDMSSTSAYAYGNIDEPLTAGRSVAMDPKIFPKGALAWIDVREGSEARRGKELGGNSSLLRPFASSLRRFVLNQDEGGAIQGPGRVDFFAGHGKTAEYFAEHFWYPGKLYFLVKKK